MAKFTLLPEKGVKEFGGKKALWVLLETEDGEHSYEHYTEIEADQMDCIGECLQKLADHWEYWNHTEFPDVEPID